VKKNLGLEPRSRGDRAGRRRPWRRPFARPAQRTLIATLRETATAYGALAAAAAGHGQASYAGAAQRVDAAEHGLDAAISRLENLRIG
jgi:hypothetical protein